MSTTSRNGRVTGDQLRGPCFWPAKPGWRGSLEFSGTMSTTLWGWGRSCTLSSIRCPCFSRWNLQSNDTVVRDLKRNNKGAQEGEVTWSLLSSSIKDFDPWESAEDILRKEFTLKGVDMAETLVNSKKGRKERMKKGTKYSGSKLEDWLKIVGFSGQKLDRSENKYIARNIQDMTA